MNKIVLFPRVIRGSRTYTKLKYQMVPSFHFSREKYSNSPQVFDKWHRSLPLTLRIFLHENNIRGGGTLLLCCPINMEYEI